MRLARSIRLSLVLVVLGAGWSSPRNKPDAAIDPVLKGKGLTKTGTTFIIEDETPVLAKMKEARTSYNAYAAMSGQHAAHEELAERATQLEQQRGELQTQIDDLNQQIGNTGTSQGNSGPPGGGMGGGGGGMGGGGGPGGRTFVSAQTIERDQLKSTLAQVTAEQKTVRNQSPQAKDTAALEARVKKADETFKSILTDLRKQVDEVKKKYADLEADDAVKAALADAKKGNPKIHLGPSDAFNAGTKELEKAEQRFLGKRTSVVSKKKAKAKK